MIDATLPTARSTGSEEEREKIRRVVARTGRCGLANDTKWDEFLAAMRARTWRPSYRFRCIDGGSSRWDVEWFYHLPFPMVAVDWLDISRLQQVTKHRLPPRVRTIDHSEWIVDLLRSAGLDFRVGASMIRVFGYAPRNLELFDE